MIEYAIRIQVIELAHREGIAEIEKVREIPEVLILSLDSDPILKIGQAIENAHRLHKLTRPNK